jgi:hypothetical protein
MNLVTHEVTPTSYGTTTLEDGRSAAMFSSILAIHLNEAGIETRLALNPKVVVYAFLPKRAKPSEVRVNVRTPEVESFREWLAANKPTVEQIPDAPTTLVLSEHIEVAFVPDHDPLREHQTEIVWVDDVPLKFDGQSFSCQYVFDGELK